MPAYIIAEVNVKDAQRYADYRQMVPATLEAYGGHFVVRGGPVHTLEGAWEPQRMVVLEFDNVDAAKAWWSSQDYAPAKALRQATADTRMILIEGA